MRWSPRWSTSPSRRTSSGSSARAVDEFGGLDLAVNCAGLGTFSPIVDHPVEEWRTVIDVCLTGVFLSVKHEAQAMRAGGHGRRDRQHRVDQREGAGGRARRRTAAPRRAWRCSPAVRRWSSVRRGSGSRASARATSRRRSPRSPSRSPRSHDAYVESIPLGRAGAADDIANAALFLVSDEASWVSGETLYVDGAESTQGLPGLHQARGLRRRTQTKPELAVDGGVNSASGGTIALQAVLASATWFISLISPR